MIYVVLENTKLNLGLAIPMRAPIIVAEEAIESNHSLQIKELRPYENSQR